jgi:predicted small lipoprotein YifL
MNLTSIILSILLLVALAACGSAPATPLALPTSAPTAAPINVQQIPTDTPPPTLVPTQAGQTSTPQPEPAPTTTMRRHASESGTFDRPLLIFPTVNGLMEVTADATIKNLFSEAVPSVVHLLKAGMSPFSGWVAFISGDSPMTPDREGSGPLMLNLLDVRTGQQQPITPLFSAEMEQALQDANNTGERDATVEAGIAVIENDHTLAWSPDGRYLAFIAAIDGPSSDVYSYDRDTGQITRLTDGPNQAARLFWSPDSQWIVHEEVENFGTGAGWNVKAVWAAAPDGSGNRKLYDTEWSGDEVFVDWIAPEAFIVYTWSPLGLQDARVFNLSKEEARQIGPDFPVQAYAVDATSQTQLYIVDDYTARENNVQGGLYLDSPAQQPQLSAPGNWYDVRWLPTANVFFAKGESGVISVALDGKTQEYSGEDALPIASPDGAWLLAWGDGNYTSPIGLRLYTTDGELARTITEDAVTLATWSPDSTGVFYVSDGMLYYVAIPNGEPQLIAEDLISSDAGSLGWVMP